jgi:hypothetical protein
MDREIESRSGLGWQVFRKKKWAKFINWHLKIFSSVDSVDRQREEEGEAPDPDEVSSGIRVNYVQYVHNVQQPLH